MPPTGIGEAPVRVLDVPGSARVVAWVSTVADEALPQDQRGIEGIVRTHDRVVSHAVDAGATVIPTPVTRAFPDDAACLRQIEARSSEIVVLEERARGCVELALLLTPPASARPDGRPSSEPGPGRQYLDAARIRLAAGTVHAVADFGAALSRAVGVLVRGESRREIAASLGPLGPHAGGLALSHLVARDAVAAYRSAVETVPLPAGVRLVIDRQRAPYSFAAFVPSGTILAD